MTAWSNDALAAVEAAASDVQCLGKRDREINNNMLLVSSIWTFPSVS